LSLSVYASWTRKHLPHVTLCVVAVASLLRLAMIERSLPASVPYDISARETELKQKLNLLPDRPQTGAEKSRVYQDLGCLYQSAGKYDQAEINVRRSLGTTDPQDHARVATLMTALGDVYRDWQKYNDADRAYNEALKEHQQCGNAKDMAKDFIDLAALAYTVGKRESNERVRSLAFARAATLLDQAADTLRKHQIEDAAVNQLIQNYREFICVETGRLEELQRMLGETGALRRGG
jgi:tetratricopeptide (TPR) repeat protein